MSKIIFLIPLFLIGCGVKSVVFKNLPFLVANEMDKYLSLSWTEEFEVRDKVEALLVSEKEQIKTLGKPIKNLKVDLSNSEEVITQVLPVYKRFAGKIIDIAVPYLTALDREEIEELKEIVADKNELIKNRSKKKRTKEITKRFEYFYGELNKDQFKFIDQRMGVFQTSNKNRLKRRLEYQKNIFQALESKGKDREDKIKTILKGNIEKISNINNFKSNIELLKEFSKTLTPEQIAFFEKRKNLFVEWIVAYGNYL